MWGHCGIRQLILTSEAAGNNIGSVPGVIVIDDGKICIVYSQLTKCSYMTYAVNISNFYWHLLKPKACANACLVCSVRSVSKMFLILSVTFPIFLRNMWGFMYWTGPFHFRWSRGYICNSSYYHHLIGSINLFHCCYIFPWLCGWKGCTIICCRFHMYISWDSWVLCLSLLYNFLMCINKYTVVW